MCKVLDDTFGVKYGMKVILSVYSDDQMFMDGRLRDLWGTRAGAGSIPFVSMGAGKASPQFKGWDRAAFVHVLDQDYDGNVQNSDYRQLLDCMPGVPSG